MGLRSAGRAASPCSVCGPSSRRSWRPPVARSAHFVLHRLELDWHELAWARDRGPFLCRECLDGRHGAQALGAPRRHAQCHRRQIYAVALNLRPPAPGRRMWCGCAPRLTASSLSAPARSRAAPSRARRIAAAANLALALRPRPIWPLQEPRMMQKLLMALVKGYRLLLSPWLGSACRLSPPARPTACKALEQHGAAVGSYLTLRRLAALPSLVRGRARPGAARKRPLFSRLLIGLPRPSAIPLEKKSS
jgi:putative component of membrane protein insertase Oxa1/YidC/SpoIIIJ protein YidD